MAHDKHEKAAPGKPPKSRKVLLRCVGLFLFAALGAGGWFAYTTCFKSDYPKEPLAYMDLDDTVLRYAWKQAPEIYRHMVRANAELALMKDEIDRINRVGKAYPRQKKIVASEKKRWEKNVRKLEGQFQRFQGQVEALYVTFRVNPEKGRHAMDEKSPDLAASMGEALAAVQAQTAPLKSARVAPGGIKGMIAKIKARLL